MTHCLPVIMTHVQSHATSMCVQYPAVSSTHQLSQWELRECNLISNTCMSGLSGMGTYSFEGVTPLHNSLQTRYLNLAPF